MNNSVIIKGNKYGIIVVMDKDMPFDELKEVFTERFKNSAKFFNNADMAISFEGRAVSDDEQKELLDIISENTDLNILCVIDNDELHEKTFKDAVEDELAKKAMNSGQFHKGTLRSGQMLESESSIIVLGDVNAGANVVSKGNVIVLGALKGTVYAGANGNENSFVVALEMAPLQIRIGDTIARSEDNNNKNKALSNEPMIAYVENGNIYIEKLEKGTINALRI